MSRSGFAWCQHAASKGRNQSTKYKRCPGKPCREVKTYHTAIWLLSIQCALPSGAQQQSSPGRASALCSLAPIALPVSAALVAGVVMLLGMVSETWGATTAKSDAMGALTALRARWWRQQPCRVADIFKSELDLVLLANSPQGIAG